MINRKLVYILLLFLNSHSYNAQSEMLNFSEFQGGMDYYSAYNKCKLLGMRLPTAKELRTAFEMKITKNWEINGSFYWSSDSNSDYNDSNLYINIRDGLIYFQGYRESSLSVRCIRS